MADDHVPTRESVHLEPVSDPLIAFFWARLDEREQCAMAIVDSNPVYTLDDVAAKKSILDDYAARCADIDNPAREMECQLIRDVIKRLATVHAEHPDYDESWRP